MIYAVSSSNFEIVNYLIKSNIDSNMVNNANESAFHYVYMNNDTEISNLLIDNNVDVNLQNTTMGNTPLHNTTINDNSLIAKFLICKKASLDIPNTDGNTPLLLALKNRAFACANELLKNDCDVNARNLKNKTPLIYAAKSDNQEIIKMLLSKGADVNYQHSLRSPLLVSFKHHAITGMEVLLSSNADPNMQFLSDGSTIVHQFASKLDQFQEEISLLKKHGLDINKKNHYGQTALMLASKVCNVQLLKYFQSLEADFALLDDKGKNVFHYSSLNEYYNLMPFLDSLNLDISIVDDLERTPMHYSRNTAQLQHMMKYHSNWYFKDKYGRTPFHTLAFEGNTSSIKFFIDNKHCDINSSDMFGRTPLHLAIQSGNMELLSLLLKTCVNVNSADNNGWTPIFFANSVEQVQLLVKHGANMNILDKSGCRLVLAFVKGGYVDIINYMIDSSCIISGVDKTGKNILHYAISLNNETLVKKIIDTNQIDINQTDNDGISPLVLAKNKNNKNLIYLLLEKGAKLDYGATTRRIFSIKIIKNIIKHAQNSSSLVVNKS